MKSLLSSSALILITTGLLLGTVAAGTQQGSSVNNRIAKNPSLSSSQQRRLQVDAINAIESNDEIGLIANFIQASAGSASRSRTSKLYSSTLDEVTVVSTGTALDQQLRGTKGGKKGNDKKNKKNGKGGKKGGSGKGKGGKGGSGKGGKSGGYYDDSYHTGTIPIHLGDNHNDHQNTVDGDQVHTDTGGGNNTNHNHNHVWEDGDGNRIEIDHTHGEGAKNHDHTNAGGNSHHDHTGDSHSHPAGDHSHDHPHTSEGDDHDNTDGNDYEHHHAWTDDRGNTVEISHTHVGGSEQHDHLGGQWMDHDHSDDTHSHPGGMDPHDHPSHDDNSNHGSDDTSDTQIAGTPAPYGKNIVSPTGKPTITGAPSISGAPSATPSISLEPSVSKAPSDIPTQSLAPTESFAPTMHAAPVESTAYCKTFPATYEVEQIEDTSGQIRTETVILMWPKGTDRDNESTAIAALNSIVNPPIYESDTDRYNIAVKFSIKPSEADMDDADTDGDQDFDLIDVGKHLDKIVSPPVVLTAAGCKTKAQGEAEAYYYANRNDNRRRKTQAYESESKLAVMRDWICKYSNGSEEDSCDDNTGVCDVTCETSINYMGLLDLDAMETILSNALPAYFSMIDDVVGWYEQQTIVIGIEQVPTDSNNNDIAEANDNAKIDQQKSAVKAGPYIGAATGLLALLLLLLLFVRRRSRYDDEEVSHLKMDDDDDDDTFVRDFGIGDAGSDDNSIPRNEYNSRDIHIVGEGDSVISHWTGYTRKSEGNYEMAYNKCGPVNGITTDVHQCSSATCEICAKNRQAGLSFVSTGAHNGERTTRSRSLPSDASRDYPADDTVEL